MTVRQVRPLGEQTDFAAEQSAPIGEEMEFARPLSTFQWLRSVIAYAEIISERETLNPHTVQGCFPAPRRLPVGRRTGLLSVTLILHEREVSPLLGEIELLPLRTALRRCDDASDPGEDAPRSCDDG
jgi:hypothetical protein